MYPIKFIDLTPDRYLANKLDEAYYRILGSGKYIGGKEVEAFENEWANYCDAKYCVGLANGHDAIALACRFMSKDNPQLRVSVPWKTCTPSWAGVKNGGCCPVPDYIDHDIQLAVHIYGQITLPLDFTRDKLIEDCAQAHGASFNNIKAGKFGRIACWSFYPTKNLGAIGDAGAITTDDEEAADYIREMSQYGFDSEIGINSRLDAMQAAFLRVKLSFLDIWNERRKQNAEAYLDVLSKSNEVILPHRFGEIDSPCWHIFAIEYPLRNELRNHLKSKNIDTMVHYPITPYPSVWKIAEANKWTKETLSLPIAPHIVPGQCAYIGNIINEWLGV